MINQLINTFCLAWVILHFEPLQKLINKLPESAVKFYTQSLFSCLMCTSFWLSLILTHNIFTASISAFLGFWYSRLISDYEKRKFN